MVPECEVKEWAAVWEWALPEWVVRVWVARECEVRECVFVKHHSLRTTLGRDASVVLRHLQSNSLGKG